MLNLKNGRRKRNEKKVEIENSTFVYVCTQET